MIQYESNYYGVPDLESDSIKHYGVIGMKWGQRRFQNKDGSLTPAGERHYAKTGEYGYKYKSFGTKHNERKSARLQKKIDATTDTAKRKALTEKKAKIDRRAELSRKLDAREQRYANSTSAAKNIASRALTTVGTKPYQQMLAMMNENRKGVTAKKVVAAVVAHTGGRAVSTIAKAMYIRQDEFNSPGAKKAKQTIRKVNSKL